MTMANFTLGRFSRGQFLTCFQIKLTNILQLSCCYFQCVAPIAVGVDVPDFKKRITSVRR